MVATHAATVLTAALDSVVRPLDEELVNVVSFLLMVRELTDNDKVAIAVCILAFVFHAARYIRNWRESLQLVVQKSPVLLAASAVDCFLVYQLEPWAAFLSGMRMFANMKSLSTGTQLNLVVDPLVFASLFVLWATSSNYLGVRMFVIRDITYHGLEVVDALYANYMSPKPSVEANSEPLLKSTTLSSDADSQNGT